MKVQKILCFIVCFFLVFCSHSPVKAGVCPLEKKGSAVNPINSNEIKLSKVISNIYFNDQNATFEAHYILKNNTQNKLSLLVGYPSDIGKISNFSVSVDGQSHKITYRKPSYNQNTYKGWFTWYLTFQPDQTRIIRINFIRQNQILDDFTRQICYTFKTCSAWSGNIDRVNIQVLYDKYAPYIFEPNPTPLVTSIHKNGTLEWDMLNYNPVQDINISFKPIDTLILNYLNNNNLSNIANAYQQKNYLKCIQLCEQYMQQNNQLENINELKYFMAQSYQNILEYEKALQIYNQIKGKKLFDEISNIIDNQILYNILIITKYLQSENNDSSSVDFQIDNKTYSQNYIFYNWLKQNQKSEIQQQTNQQNNTDKKQQPEQTEQPEKKENNFSTETVLFAGIILGFLIGKLIYKPKKRKRSYYY